MQKRVISCSRRTDIPAFYSEWLINRLRAGYCHVINPFGGKVYQVSLRPDDCLAIVFWTRNPAPLMKHLDELNSRGYYYYFHYGILGYPKELESHNPSIDAAISTFKKLSDMISPARMRWRYDPLIFSSITPPEYHLDNFEKIARALSNYTNHCTFSFVDFYGKTSRNLQVVASKTGIEIFHPSITEQRDFIRKLLPIADSYGMTLNSCCNDDLVVQGTFKNHCIDIALLRQLRPSIKLDLKAEPTRKDCGCVSSVDIGSYDTCLFGCTYCYATNNGTLAIKRNSEHNPLDTVLLRPGSLAGTDLHRVATLLKK